ncbi:MAG: M28 family peptidase [Pseudomonadota bacterium]
MKRLHWIRCMMVLAMVFLAGFLAGACEGDLSTDGDADAQAEVIDDGREDAPADQPADDGVPDEDTPDAQEDPGADGSDTPDVDEDAEEPDAEPPIDCNAIHEYITTEGLVSHLTELEAIAADNGNNRAAGTSGWDDSVLYVRGRLEAAGYAVELPAIDYPYYEVVSDPLLERIAPTAHTYDYASNDETPVGEFQKMGLSPPGDVTADVTPVDLELGSGNSSTSGCEAGDFTGFTAGHIALVQRGTCYFVEKALNAQEAGAAGVLIFNQGDTRDREGLLAGGPAMYPLDAGPDHGVDIPVLFANYAVGEEIANLISEGSTVNLHMQVNTIFEIRETQNILAETAGGDANDVVMFGAHLDSVPEGPGINDNGSGVAAVLEIARVASGCEVARKLRFAFWGAEELGLWGSSTYVSNLTRTELDHIHSYNNVDMIGSVNYAIFVFDGDGSDSGDEWPPGSAELERFFLNDMSEHGLGAVPFSGGGSDHVSFGMMGVGVSYLFSGVGIKTAAEAAEFGGHVGRPHDPCYHQPCDTVGNVGPVIVETMTRSLARAAQFFGVDGLDMPL